LTAYSVPVPPRVFQRPLASQPKQAAAAALRSALLRDVSSSAIAVPGQVSAVHGDAFARALAFYEQGQWLNAFKALTQLADAGHAPAAKLALLMLRYGASLYGMPLHAEAPQIARWAGLVIDAGRMAPEARGLRQ